MELVRIGRPALTAVKAVVVGAVLSLLVVAGLTHAGSTKAPHTGTAAQVVRAVLDHTRPDARCTRLGAPTAVTADRAAALVRSPSGALHLVPFKEAWEVYTGQQSGTFVSLCLGRSPS